MASIRFKATRIEADLDGSFLANKNSSSLGSAETRGKTDFHITGSPHAHEALLTTKSTTFEIALSQDDFKIFKTRKVGRPVKTVSINDRVRLNATTSRTGIAIDGAVVDVMAGQGSSLIKDIFEDQKDACSHAMPMQYASWLAYSAILNVSGAEVIDTETGKPFSSATFKNDAARDARSEASLKLVEAKYLTGVKRRSVIRFEPIVELSKSVMRVPVGIHGSGYDLSCNVVDRPQPLSDMAFESLAAATLRNVLLGDAEAFGEFMTACSAGISVAASTKFADTACTTMSFIAAAITPYRVDGISHLMPTGLQTVASESWKAEAPRSISTADDCDGSGAGGCSALYRAALIAGDASLYKQFPVTAAIANALGHHVIGVCVLAANAGHADAADTNAKSLAGHAIALAVPRAMMLTGLTATALHSRSITVPGDDIHDHMAAVEGVKATWTESLYPDDILARMPDLGERDLFATPEGVSGHATTFTTLSMEGTSPVAPSILHEPNLERRWRDKRMAAADRELSEKVGPTVARKVSSLHVSDGDEHQFYNSLVEFLTPPRKTALFTGEAARESNFCASHFVFTSASDPTSAGATPKELSMGDFGVAPLWTATAAEADLLLEASHEVLSNTLQVRKGPERLNAARSASYASNLKRLDEMNARLHRPNDGQATLDYIVPFAALIDNEAAIGVLCDHVESVCSSSSSSAAAVEVQDVPGLLEDADGNDIGKLVMLTISMAS
ncbi:hypothetical protein N9S30_00110 [bacterium]|nr:hypothetical protein [bacterium]